MVKMARGITLIIADAERATIDNRHEPIMADKDQPVRLANPRLDQLPGYAIILILNISDIKYQYGDVMRFRILGLLLLGIWAPVFLVGCGGGGQAELAGVTANANELVLPELTPLALNGTPLKVVATTSIIGDVVGRIGGSAIALTTLMGPGHDPHSFEPAARDLTAVAEAALIFVNGWNLEEGLVDDLTAIAGDVPVVPISAGIQPHSFIEAEYDEGDHDEAAHNEDEHVHGAIDPHVWLALDNVGQWVDNVVTVLTTLDPVNAAVYEVNGAAYQAELAVLADYAATEIARIPQERRLLVTNHGSLGYLADAYDFEVLGTVIPAFSTLAEPSASDLAALIELMAEHNLCTVFSETTVADTLAQTVSGELANCAEVRVLPLYTGSLGPADSPASSFVELYRFNIDQLVLGLAPAASN